MHRLAVLFAAMALTGVGCGETMMSADSGGRLDSGGGLDSGPPRDTGPQPDTGPPSDTGPQPDTGPGPIDSGRPDSGPVDCAAAIPTTLGTVSIVSGAGSFSSPVQVVQPPGSTDLYVVERAGLVRIVRAGMILPTPFLDISPALRGIPSGDAEWGLLSLAFHPEYAANGRFYVGYTPNRGANTIGEGTRSATPEVANPTVMPVVEVPDIDGNHNGGLVMFGPEDGFLYAGMGDGGGSCDPRRNGQDLNTRLGKILRYDASVAGALTPAAGNPFLGMAGRDAAIWDFGLRNPWRFSFDRMTGDLWIGDVGQGAREEIDLSVGNPGAQNYGWVPFEGSLADTCRTGTPLATGTTHHLPLTEYPRAVGQTVVGGFVYRGSAIPALQGVYLYADAYGGWVRGLRMCGGLITAGPTEIMGIGIDVGGAGLVSFGEDNAGELYAVFLTGQVARITAP